MLHTLERKATQILDAAQGADHDGIVLVPDLSPPSQPLTMPQERVDAALATCQQRLKAPYDVRRNPVPYEAPELTVNMTIDDVGVTRQKTERGSSASVPEQSSAQKVSNAAQLEMIMQN